MLMKTIATRFSMLGLLAVLPASLPAGQPDKVDMQREGIERIRELEEVGRNVRYHAARLNSFGGNLQVTGRAHTHHLEQIRGLVNNGLRPALTHLSEIQPHLPEWKQEGINRMLDAARALAAAMNSAILVKSEAGPAPPAMNHEYRKAIASIYGHAEVLVKTSDAAGSYAAARLKAVEAGLKAGT